MQSPAAAPAAEPSVAVRFWLRHQDLLLLAGLTLLAAALRLWDLGAIPQGIHGDEAQVGMDARRVLDQGWIGPYTPAALGQPAGHAYLTAPAIAIFGSTDWAVRLPLALTGIAAVPLSYALFRLHTSRTLALMAGFLLAISLWHLHYSRVAHWPISYVTVGLGVLVLWSLALRSGRWYWFAGAGALLGLGLYTYNVYPVFVIAFAVWVAIYTLAFKRGPGLMRWARQVALAAAVSVVVGLPLFLYMADPANDYFSHYRGYYRQYSVLQSDAFKAADFEGKLDIIVDKVWSFLGAYAWKGIPDFVDGASPDRRPMFDPLTVLLIAAGVGYAVWRWRQTQNLLALVLLAVIPLTTVLQTNAIYRGPLGTAPFICYFAALPLALTWDGAKGLRRGQRLAVHAVVIGILGLLTFLNLNAYFKDWAHNDLFPWVYAQEISEASKYIAEQPGQPYVYFFSARWSFNYETRQYLAKDARGEDRSREFGRFNLGFDRSRDALVVLLAPYLEILPALQQIYPDGKVITHNDGERVLFAALHLPALPTALPGP